MMSLERKATLIFQYGHFIVAISLKSVPVSAAFYFEYVRCRRLVITTWRRPGG